MGSGNVLFVGHLRMMLHTYQVSLVSSLVFMSLVAML